MAGAEDYASIGAGVVLAGQVHHRTHHFRQVGRAGREVGVLEHPHARLEVGDDDGGRGSDLEAEDVAVLGAEAEEAAEEVVGEVVHGADQRQVGRARGEGGREALLLISGVWAWAIMSIKTARPAAIKEQTVKVSQFLRACKEQTVILWTSAIGNFNIIRRQRACKEQKTIQGISAISNLYRYVDMLEHCRCLSCAELCVCV